MRRVRRQIEKFNECPVCRSYNTHQVGTSDDYHHIWFFGWCFDCDEGYQYDMRVETVRDRKGRL